MSKVKKAWFCQNCGAESSKWLGRCPSCGAWNTYVEEVVRTSVDKPGKITSQVGAVPIGEISMARQERILLNNNELDRILGGGLVPGSLVLIGGEPGIGKSTLSLQIPLHSPHLKTLYVSGEESARQIRMRSERLKPASDSEGSPDNCLVLCETMLENILDQAQKTEPSLLIVDSIQTVYSQNLDPSPGSVTQVRECAALLLKYAKESHVPVILVGHITKEGSIAGPKVLEHIVDVVLQFEGDNTHAYRILRSIKNRYGSTAELALFEMTQKGLRQVDNPSEMLIPMHDENLSGIAVAAMLDGTRPFLIETQALVSTAAYGTPQRSATGFDTRRMNMLLAVLEKRAGFRLSAKDVFLNMAGGLRVSDPAVDLAVAVAILSSDFDIVIPARWCFAAEVGLSGEIRPVPHLERRIAEADRLGFEKIFISGYNAPAHIPRETNIQVEKVTGMGSLSRRIFKT